MARGTSLTVCGNTSKASCENVLTLNDIDSMVSPVKDTQRMITSHAYLLFYRRRSDRPLGGPKLEEVMRGFERSSEETNDDITNNNEGTESR